MNMKPMPRTIMLTAHVVLSVGWLGAVAAYLSLAVVGLTSGDPQAARAAYVSMELIGWWVIVPFAIATLMAGLVESLGTPWGLIRHWWVLAKFVLTAGAVVVLLQHMPTVTRMSGIAREAMLAAADFRELRVQLVLHAGGGLLVLLATTALSIVKPWGVTPYGRRTQAGRGQLAPPVLVPTPAREVAEGGAVARRAPRWVYVAGIHAIGLLVLLLVAHVAGGGAWIH